MIIKSKEPTLLLDIKTETLVREYIPSQKHLSGIANFFSSLADETRIKIVSALAVSPMCVNDLSNVLSLNQTTVSHQLRNLKNTGVVKCRRQGKISFYSICDNTILDVMMSAVNFL